MKPDSRQIIHIGINFVVVPNISLGMSNVIRFQESIIKNGLDYTSVQQLEDRITIKRDTPSPLIISAISQKQQPVGQLLVVAPQPQYSLDMFIKEAEAASKAFVDVWPSPIMQIIHSDATIRELHETTSEHAFEELWEHRLRQSKDSLKTFGKPIRGGGLRFVMEPNQSELDPIQVEVKIESYFQNTRKIFLETIFRWVKPTSQGAGINISEKLIGMEDYISQNVLKFLTGDNDVN